MRRTAPLLLFFVLLLSTVAGAQTSFAQSARQAQSRVGAIQTVAFESKLVGKRLPYQVLLPIGYERPARKTTRYSVLYLLHGYSGDHTNWLSKTKLADYAATHQLIIVTPEGENSWYTDSATAPNYKFESYIVEELIADVAKRFRTIETREARGIAGLSMGGYGALKFGVKHADKFALAASLSGAVSAASWRTTDDLPSRLRPSMLQTFGAPGSATKNANDLFKLLNELPAERLAHLPFFYLDCGTEDELQLLAPNRALADLFLARKIPHEFRELPGKHNWQFWDAQIQDVLKLAAQKLSPAQAVVYWQRHRQIIESKSNNQR